MRLCLLVFLLFSVSFFPQAKKSEMSEMRIIGMAEYHPEELIDYDVKDANGDVAAGLIIETDLVGLAYDANLGMVKMNHSPGRDFLFLQYKEREVKILLSGYAPLQVILKNYGIKLEQGRSWLIKLTADKKSELIPISINTTPPGATIFIDGENKGQLKNITLKDGEHDLKIELDGYTTVNEKIIVNINSAYFEYKLTQIELIKTLIASTPKNAQIILDGSINGKTDKQLFLKSGKYKLNLVLSEYIGIDTLIEVKSGGLNSFKFNLIKNSGILLTELSPANAQISIDGKLADKSRNERLPGKHEVAVTAEGFIRMTDTVLIVCGETLSRKYALLKNSGVLNIAVEPADAEIMIDGKIASKNRNELLPGLHTVSVIAEGYLRDADTIDIARGETVNRSYTLLKNTGILNLSFEPSDASVTINGEQYNSGKIELPPGAYQIEISKESYKTVKEVVNFPRGVTLSKNYKLQAITGSLMLSVSPIEAKVEMFSKGKLLKTWTGSELLNDLLIGDYQLKFSMRGYAAVTRDIKIEENKQIKEELELKPQSVTGTLDFSVVPSYAFVELYNDGKYIKSWKGSETLRDLPVGDYQIKCTLEGYTSVNKSITVNEGRTSYETVDMKSVRNSIASQESSWNNSPKQADNSSNAKVKFLIPGLYQLGGSRETAGYVGLAAGAGAWTFYALQYLSASTKLKTYKDFYDNTYKATPTLENRAQALSLKKQADDASSAVSTAWIIIGAVYAVNILDGLLFDNSPGNNYSLSVNPAENNFTALTYKFNLRISL